MIYGYMRISTRKQNTERQRRNILEAYPNAKISGDVWTGTESNRPEWNKLMNKVKAGDTIVFDSVSRMSRNASEGVELYEQLFQMNVTLVFLNEPLINTEVYKKSISDTIPLTNTDVDLILNGVNAYLIQLAKNQVKIAFEQAEKEVSDLKKRTIGGMETARLAGKQIGRKQGAKITTTKSVKAKAVIKKALQSI